MNANWKNRMTLAAVTVVVVAALLVLTTRWQPARAEREEGAVSSSRYSVVETEAHNLIVTDNKTSTLYFYTIGKDKEVGSDLKLRGSIDLTQVGRPVIKIEKAKSE